jgi:hypothetical protein
MSQSIKTKVIEQMDILPEDLQRKVLSFAQSLQMRAQRGVPGKDLLEFAGTIPLDDLELMQQAVEGECEQVNLDEW